ncbi:MAG TPA: acyltransferase [Devosia sp.]|nr:acyltransferase [Devosia sp.]
MAGAGPSKLPWLQALRAIAALLVVVAHAIYTLNERAGLPAGYLPAAGWIGTAGVAIFFAISGFIMTHITEGEFQRAGASRDFIVRRLVRIVPLYWLATIIYCGKLFIEGGLPPALDLVRSFLFIPYLDATNAVRPVYGLGWTLDYEMYFYLALALALLLPRRIGLTLASVALAVPVAVGLVFGRQAGNTLAVFASEPLILMFLLGVGIRSFLYRPGSGASNADAGGRVTDVLVGLGDASYSIYLTHSFLLGPMGRIWGAVAPPAAWPLFVIASLVAASIVGWLVHRYVEVPMLKLLGRWVTRPKRRLARA